MRGLTDTERTRLDRICRGIAGGKTATEAAAEIGLNPSRLGGLLGRAHNAGFDYLRGIACIYADRFAESIAAGTEPPEMPGQNYRTAIGIECARRGYDLRLLPKIKDRGIDRTRAKREIEYRTGQLEQAELDRLKELMFFKVRLRECWSRKDRKRRRKRT